MAKRQKLHTTKGSTPITLLVCYSIQKPMCGFKLLVSPHGPSFSVKENLKQKLMWDGLSDFFSKKNKLNILISRPVIQFKKLKG